jgi:thiosulfate/3-mercaptopyruvate sulfurtransferase
VLDPSAHLRDARPASRYRGLDAPEDPRSGHIPGAKSLFWRDTLDGDGRLRPTDEIRGLVDDADRDTVVAYCGNGVGACHLLLALEHAGVMGRLYAGSWTEYRRTDLPVAR